MNSRIQIGMISFGLLLLVANLIATPNPIMVPAVGSAVSTSILRSDCLIRILVTVLAISLVGIILALLLIQSRTQCQKAEANVQALNAELSQTRHMIRIDPLTRVNNRRGLEDLLHTESQRAKRSCAPLCAVLIDLDDFKHINESYGHAGGDAVLKEVAQRMKAMIRPSDHACRVGGDEFVILFPNTAAAEAVNVANRVRAAIASSSIVFGGKRIEATVSMGVAALPENIAEIEELLLRTRRALKLSKLSGKNNVATGDKATWEVVRGISEQIRDLIASLAGGDGLRLFVQPLYDLRQDKAVAKEFSVHGPEGDISKPDKLLQFCRKHNIETAVDLRCVAKCVEFASQEPHTIFHVPVLPSTLLNADMHQILEVFGNSTNIRIQVSEQLIDGDRERLASRLGELREFGFGTILSDYGHGTSSIESVLLLQPQFVKLSSAFLSDHRHNQEESRRLNQLAFMLRAANVTTIASGLSSADDVVAMKDLGINYAEGSFWGMPARTLIKTAEVSMKSAVKVRTLVNKFRKTTVVA